MQITGGLTFTGGVNVVSDHDPYWSNVVILLNTSSSNNLNNFTFIDSSDNNIAITQYNNTPQGSTSAFTTKPYLTPSYSTSQNGGGVYMIGSNTANMYLTTANSSALSFGTGDFTIETWVNTPAAPGGGVTNDKTVFGNFDWVANTNYLYCYLENATNTPRLFDKNNTWAANTAVTTNTFTHIAYVRKSGVMNIYVNGANAGPGTACTTNWTRPNTVPYIGKGSADATRYFPGYISSLRVSNSAVYSTNFTPSTTPLTKNSNTCLLLNFTNAGMYDVSNNQFLISSPNVVTNTTTTKFGPSSANFSGTGSSLVNGRDFSCNLATNNFTIEGWIYPTTTNANLSLTGFCDSTPNNANTSFRLNISSTNKLTSVVCSGTTAYTCTSAANITSNTWTHIAFVRNGATLTQYINGTADGSNNIGAATSVNSGSGQTFAIGRLGGNTGNLFQGYMEQYRLTNGAARYTSNFTAPTSAFPTF